MRRIVLLPAALLVLHLFGGASSAQTHFNGLGAYPVNGYALPPRAPDFQNTRPFYYTTCFGMTYGPNYCVYPGFAPYQGMLPGPVCAPNMPSGEDVIRAKQLGIAAFPSHLYARGPRDYFMVDTDPRATPYSWGLAGYPSAPTAAPALPVGPTPYEP